MQANQKLIASDGKEIFLFPCDAMYLTPARIPPEHDVLALDFLPRDTNGNKITGMKCYAPFSGTIVYTGADHNLILESDDVVHTPNGLKKMRVLVAHSYIAPVKGTHYNQGDHFYTTGNYGQSSGEHLHMEISEANSSNYWNSNGIGLRDAVHMWQGLFVNDTALLRTGDFNWEEYYIPPSPTSNNKIIGVWNSIYRYKRKEVN